MVEILDCKCLELTIKNFSIGIGKGEAIGEITEWLLRKLELFWGWKKSPGTKTIVPLE